MPGVADVHSERTEISMAHRNDFERKEERIEVDESKDWSRRVRPESIQTRAWALVPAVLGFAFAWGTLLVAHSPLIHQGSRALDKGNLSPPDAKTCRPSAASCWDGAEKYGYPTCTSSELVWTTIRGERLPERSQTCYKSLLINSEFNSGVGLGLVMFWGAFTSRLFERAAEAMMAGDAEYRLIAALCACIPSWYYSVKVLFVYVNEWMHAWILHQLFYSITDGALLYLVSRNLRRDSQVCLASLSVVVVTSLAHMIEFCLDENLNFTTGKNMSGARNVILFLGDISLFAASLLVITSQRGGVERMRMWAPRLACLLIAELVGFQIVADSLSFSIKTFWGG